MNPRGKYRERQTILSKISFLTNEDIWKTIPEIIKASKHTDVAVAYLGTDGAKLLPLKKGDRLVVDMSPATIKAGATNLFEIEKLIKRGVKVFSRRDLHAKIVLTDKALLVGSTNISKRSQNILDEAAIFTTDPIAILRSRDFIEQICLEPVSQKYLKACKSDYKPPRLSGTKSTKTQKSVPPVLHAKLRIVSLIVDDVPEKEWGKYERSKAKARKLIKAETSFLETFDWPYKTKMVDELEKGDWVIQCVKQDDGRILVSPPCRLLLVDHYVRDEETKKERYVFHLERIIGS